MSANATIVISNQNRSRFRTEGSVTMRPTMPHRAVGRSALDSEHRTLVGERERWYADGSVQGIEEVVPVNELTMVLLRGVTVGR